MNAELLRDPKKIKGGTKRYILVTGAAGYIGSVVAEELFRHGHNIIALDNMSQGHLAAVPREATFIEGDLNDADLLDRIFQEYQIESVVHLAAYTLVSESVSNPAKYFQNNLSGALNLLNTMQRYQVSKMVFSSSCAIYNANQADKISESTPKEPINPYGEAKLMLEKILRWYWDAYGLSSVSLRYFNAAGATSSNGESHDPETHLIPNIINAALKKGKTVSVFGNKYPTPDGTCVRDYVHVSDIARAHILALRQLGEKAGCRAYNLGTGSGYSVLEVIDAVCRISGVDIPVVFSGPRPGDPPVLVADASLAKKELCWEPYFSDLETIIESAYRWMSQHQDGYKDKCRINELLKIISWQNAAETGYRLCRG
jgi:UDP-glucose 4-epimerase